MIDTIVVNVAPGETRVALLADGRTVEVFHHRAGSESIVGGLYLGRVTRVAPGLQAAFVDIGAERPGFLNADDARTDADAPAAPIGEYVHEGEAVVVQVTRDAVGDKGARLTMRPTLVGRHLVYAPGRGDIDVSRRIDDEAERKRLEALVGGLAQGDEGFVVRTAAAGVAAEQIARDADELRALWGEVETQRRGAAAPARLHGDDDPLARALRDNAGGGLRRVVIDSATALADAKRYCARFAPDLAARIEAYREAEPIFERFAVEAALDEALEPRVALSSGGAVVIEETEALTAIDVDTGGAGGGGGDAQSNLLRANLEAAAEIARQLRLRAIGGLIVIDFARMTRVAHQRQLFEAFRDALAPDRAVNPPAGFTRLGLVEMTRRRRRRALAEVLCEPRDGRRRKTALSVALDIARAVVCEAAAGPRAVIAAPEVAAALSSPETGALAALAETLGRPLEVRADAARAREAYDIVGE
ncbi:MAG: Rne/Rng family ribonuclease [Alphaproteobacteria bacterium]